MLDRPCRRGLPLYARLPAHDGPSVVAGGQRVHRGGPASPLFRAPVPRAARCPPLVAHLRGRSSPVRTGQLF